MPGTATDGGIVRYTVTVTNAGTAAYPGVTLTDDLAGVLDDAAYDDNATAGTLTYSRPVLTWTGDVPARHTVTITYSTVDNPDTGDRNLSNAVTTAAGSACHPNCTITTPVRTGNPYLPVTG